MAYDKLFEIRYVRPEGRYAWVWLLAEPSDSLEIVNVASLEPSFFEGLEKGLRSVLGGRAFKTVLTKAKTHDVDSSPLSFRKAGIQAGELILQHDFETHCGGEVNE